MTKQDNETQETAETPGQPGVDTKTAAAEQESSPDEQEGTPDPRNAEAAKWRHRAKDAATGLDAAKLLLDGYADQVTALQRQIVGQHVATTFANAEDFHRSADLAELVDDSGAVDLAKVDEVAQRIIAANPHYAKGRDTPSAVPASLVTTNTPTTITPGGEKPRWSDVLTQGSKLG